MNILETERYHTSMEEEEESQVESNDENIFGDDFEDFTKGA